MNTKLRPSPALRRRAFAAAALATGVLAGLPGMTGAQSTEAPARLLVGFPAGGSFDAIARLLADKLKDELKRPVLVDNKPGAGGRLAVDVLKAAAHDGSTVMLGPDALVALYPFTYAKLSYDPVKDLVPVGTVSEFPFALAVGKEPPAATLADYVAWARQNPEKANFGVPALGAPHHFFGLVLGKTIGVPMQEVAFQGSAPALVALMGGQVSANIDVMPSLVEQHKGSKIRILAVSSPQRVPQVPEVPTFAEAGYPSIGGMGFNALYAPAGTPPDTVARWNQALNRVLAQPEVKAKLEGWGFLAAPGTPAALAERGAASAARWAPTIKASGFRAD